MRHFKQHTSRDCALACIAIASSAFGKKYSLSYLKCFGKFPDSQLNMLQLKNALEAIGFKASGVELSLLQLRRTEGIFILHYNEGHYVVYGGYKQGKHKIFDPARGIKRLSEEELHEKYSGRAILVCEGEGEYWPNQAEGPSWIRLLVDFARRKLKAAALIILIALVLQVLGLVYPFVVAAVVDHVVVKNGLGNLTKIAVLAVATMGSMLWFGIWKTYLAARLFRRAVISIQSEVISGLVKKPVDFFRLYLVGDLIERVDKSQYLAGQFARFVVDGSLYILNIIVFTLALALIDVQLLSVVGVFALARLLLVVWARPRFARNARASAIASAGYNDAKIALFNGIGELRAIGRGEKAAELVDLRLRKCMDALYSQVVVSGVYESVQAFVASAAPIAVLLFGASRVVDEELPFGNLLAGNILAAGLLAPIGALAQSILLLSEAATQLPRLGELLVVDGGNKELINTEEVGDRLLVTGVSFRYNVFSDYILESVDVVAKKGEVVGIRGESGSGKSTLGRLLVGDEGPTLGVIQLGSVHSNEFEKAGVRGVYVSAKPHLVGATLGDIFGVDQDSRQGKDFQSAIQALDLITLIDRLGGLDQPVDNIERFVSFGELQRIGILRSLVAAPTILILDEALSGVSHLQAERIIEYVRLRHIILFLITHRQSTLSLADRVYMVAERSIEEHLD